MIISNFKRDASIAEQQNHTKEIFQDLEYFLTRHMKHSAFHDLAKTTNQRSSLCDKEDKLTFLIV